MATMTPLQHFLQESIGQETLKHASVVSDGAKLHSNRRKLRAHKVTSSFGNSHSRTSTSLHSLPSLTLDSPVCRWESCAKKPVACFSPSKPKRLGSFNVTKRMLIPASPMILSSPDLTIKDTAKDRFQSPTAPVRKSSFRDLPSRPPCWSGSNDETCAGPSPTSVVREGLSEILDRALQHCADLEDDLMREESPERRGRSGYQRCC